MFLFVMRTPILQGWLNELEGRDEPTSYDDVKTKSVLAQLSGKLLRISRPNREFVLNSEAIYNDLMLTTVDPDMSTHSVYDLTNAKVLSVFLSSLI
jgi:hypothetical protein